MFSVIIQTQLREKKAQVDRKVLPSISQYYGKIQLRETNTEGQASF